MGRRNDHTKLELKEMIILASQEIIAKESFAQFSTRKVAKKIGYTVGTLYHLFESHDNLILHINALTLDKMHQFIVENLEHHLGGTDYIKSLAKAYLGFAKKNHFIWRTLFEYNLAPEKEIPEWYMAKIQTLFSTIEKPLSPILKNPEKVESASKTIWAGIHGICDLGLTNKLDLLSTQSIEELMENLIDHYFLGLNHEK